MILPTQIPGLLMSKKKKKNPRTSFLFGFKEYKTTIALNRILPEV
jgi:hypothetical protein